MNRGTERAWKAATLLVLMLSVAAAAFYSWQSRDVSGPVKESQVEIEPLLPSICRFAIHEGEGFITCTVDPREFRIELALTDAGGPAHGSLAAYLGAMAATGSMPVIAMNGGMYHSDMRPVGLHVEEGREIAPLETADGEGNFYLKPNGVFFIGNDGEAHVMETQAFAAAGIRPRLATQSGPMLVIGGALHPRFLPDGSSRFIRNGVGVRADGMVVLAISRDPVSLGLFARAFRDGFGCPDALFLDGGISAFAAKGELVIGGKDPAGPILAVFGPQGG